MRVSVAECEGKDDSMIVQQSLADMEYFTCLYVRYEQKLLRYILRISAFSHAEAEEVLQEVFIKAWENLNEFDQSLKFSSWIYRITHNTTISEWKKKKSHGKDREEHMDEELFDNLPSALNLEAEADRHLQAEKARRVLRLLPEKYGGILILKFLEDKDYNEISDILKMPAGTVATRISRAKKAFVEAARRNSISFTLS
ncbi:MAG: sigma-70 family RNA polymerase sigma factor [Candidatus Peribacteraceae bacterium]|nr:sigma-70 family RNA polymerase sigma factor [Candidatus Peribacteraceae bacterium]